MTCCRKSFLRSIFFYQSPCGKLEDLTLSVRESRDVVFYGRLERVFVHPLETPLTTLTSLALRLAADDCAEILSFVRCHVAKSDRPVAWRRFWAQQLHRPSTALTELTALACADAESDAGPPVDRDALCSLLSLNAANYMRGHFYAPQARTIELTYAGSVIEPHQLLEQRTFPNEEQMTKLQSRIHNRDDLSVIILSS